MRGLARPGEEGGIYQRIRGHSGPLAASGLWSPTDLALILALATDQLGDHNGAVLI